MKILTTHPPVDPVRLLPYVAQGNDSSCFVIAAINACIYKGVEPPDYDELCDLAACRNGGTIHDDKVIEACGLKMRPTRNHKDVFERGGILSIYLPKHNGHCCFVGLGADGYWGSGYVIVNAWLGPAVDYCSRSCIDWYLGEYAADRVGVSIGDHWAFETHGRRGSVLGGSESTAR